MGISVKDFAEKILKMDYNSLKKSSVSIKFIVAQGKVIFDPELFVNFEKTHGEGSLYHKDIADANHIDRGHISGGAFARISANEIRIAGVSMDFGSIKDEYEETVKKYFEDYFDNSVPVIIDL
ncbi:MAG: hypothetical protein FWC36_03135 [Spirochaetes bacterium]|nr:hypothetical protein [Spirochaetota bacterium]